MSRTIYFDNNATTQPLDEVVEAMLPILRTEYANPSSVHRFGQSARHQVEVAREKVAALINASPREIVRKASPIARWLDASPHVMVFDGACAS